MKKIRVGCGDQIFQIFQILQILQIFQILQNFENFYLVFFFQFLPFLPLILPFNFLIKVHSLEWTNMTGALHMIMIMICGGSCKGADTNIMILLS